MVHSAIFVTMNCIQLSKKSSTILLYWKVPSMYIVWTSHKKFKSFAHEKKSKHTTFLELSFNNKNGSPCNVKMFISRNQSCTDCIEVGLAGRIFRRLSYIFFRTRSMSLTEIVVHELCPIFRKIIFWASYLHLLPLYA